MKSLVNLVIATTAIGAGVTMLAVADPVRADITGPVMQMRADLVHTEELRMLAAKEKDVIKLNCINDKLVEMKPELNIAEREELDFRSATNPNDQRTAFDLVSQAADTVHGLRGEAEACAGERLLLTESSNTYTHPDLPDGPYETFGTTIEPPAYASPFN